MMKPIYNYLDYRQYLHDLFRSIKKQRRRFSYRSFARMAGSSSPNYLQLILKHKIKLSPQGIRALSDAIKLNESEKEYFKKLVEFNESDNAVQKSRLFRQLISIGIKTVGFVLPEEQYSFFSKWYFPVVRELCVHPGFTGELSWISERIVPKITEQQAGEAIRFLESAGLIRYQTRSKRWIQSDHVVKTSTEANSRAIGKYHYDVIGLSRDSIERFTSSERDIRSITLSVDKKHFEIVKERIVSLWEDILAVSGQAQESATSEIFQVNIQFFPLTDCRSIKEAS